MAVAHHPTQSKALRPGNRKIQEPTHHGRCRGWSIKSLLLWFALFSGGLLYSCGPMYEDQKIKYKNNVFINNRQPTIHSGVLPATIAPCNAWSMNRRESSHPR